MQQQVTARELNRMIETKRVERKATFVKIADMCQARVIKYAKRDMQRCVFEVPEFILGTPPYDLNEAIKFIISRLQDNGFLVRYFFPRLLYISWDTEEIDGKKLMHPLHHGAPAQQRLLLPPPPPSQPPPQFVVAPKQVEHRAAHPLLPPPISTSRPPTIVVAQDVVMPHLPSLELPLPVSTTAPRPKPPQQARAPSQPPPATPAQGTFFKSIADFKPSGKFVLNLS